MIAQDDAHFPSLVTNVTNGIDYGLSHARARAREGGLPTAQAGDVVTGRLCAGDGPFCRHPEPGCGGGDRAGDLP